ncbi:MAG: SGNH/GDSL hydrolase family protein [Cyanobacteria bacterium J06636_27]
MLKNTISNQTNHSNFISLVQTLRKYWIFPSIATTLLIFELTLRFALGLGNPPLSQVDSDTGYRFKPNQKITRFGKKIEYNQYSQRSEPIKNPKPQAITRILMTGDSVTNGGSPTNQTEIITEQLERKLSSTIAKFEVLNASAGSWGIGNQLGYLRKFGIFESDAVIIQIGTHDLRQATSTSERVGRNINYPNHPPLLATQELISRYILPKLFSALKFDSEIPQVSETERNQQFQQNIQSLKAMISLIKANQTPVIVLFTPSRADLLPSLNTPKYKPEFLQILKQLKIPVVDTHATWSKLPVATVKSYYRDKVHFNETGNQAIADLLSRELCANQLKYCSNN